MPLPDFDDRAVALAKKLYRNWLKNNQNTPFRSDWMEFYQSAAIFLGLKDPASRQ